MQCKNRKGKIVEDRAIIKVKTWQCQRRQGNVREFKASRGKVTDLARRFWAYFNAFLDLYKRNEFVGGGDLNPESHPLNTPMSTQVLSSLVKAIIVKASLVKSCQCNLEICKGKIWTGWQGNGNH